jgi:hypothetical protein
MSDFIFALVSAGMGASMGVSITAGISALALLRQRDKYKALQREKDLLQAQLSSLKYVASAVTRQYGHCGILVVPNTKPTGSDLRWSFSPHELYLELRAKKGGNGASQNH